MEINKYRDITGVVTAEAIPEGRMVLLINHNQTHDFGSREDLPAAKLPDTTTEAAMAHFCIAFAVDNTQPPLYKPMPSLGVFATRYGFESASNMPFNADVTMVPDSNTIGRTIPSGALALAFGPGTFTVPSGAFVYSAEMEVPGNWLTVADTASDGAAAAGMLKYSATATPMQVERYDDTNNRLTFRINY